MRYANTRTVKEILSNKLLFSSALILALSFLIQLFYWFYFYLKFLLKKPTKETPGNYPPVSVIITARNESSNLEKFLPSILNQDYPDYQVIVVNHASTDDTGFVLKKFTQKYPHLYVTTIPYSPASYHSKKLALIIGIKAAKNDILLFTDADCKPVSKHWIRQMVRNFDQNTKIVLGYGAYAKSKGLLDKWIRTDTAFIAMQYFGFALQGLPYMGVGRNIAWRKSFFEEKGGFQAHYYVESGSDDIFVNHFGTRDNTKVEFSKESFTVSIQPKRWKEWTLMKKRHFGSAKFYRFKYKFLLTLEPISRIFLPISAFSTFWLMNFNFWPIFIYFIRELWSILMFIFAARKLNEKNVWWFFPIYDWIQPFTNFFTFLAKKHKQKWT